MVAGDARHVISSRPIFWTRYMEKVESVVRSAIIGVVAHWVRVSTFYIYFIKIHFVAFIIIVNYYHLLSFIIICYYLCTIYTIIIILLLLFIIINYFIINYYYLFIIIIHFICNITPSIGRKYQKTFTTFVSPFLS